MNALGGALATLVLFPWLLMLGLGGLRAEVWSEIPAPSFAGSFILTGVIYLVSLPVALFMGSVTVGKPEVVGTT